MIRIDKNTLEHAREYAKFAHNSINQKRKYSGEPYWKHPVRVAKIVSFFTNDYSILAASLLHDTVEDVPHITIEEIKANFGPRITILVNALTNKFTKENYPNLNRAQRHAREVKRLSKISNGAKLIKLADLFDNTLDIVKNDPEFAKVYLKEKEDLISHLKVGGRGYILWWIVKIQLRINKIRLKIKKIKNEKNLRKNL